MGDFGPILVLTYKNHALDEFLLDLLPFVKNADKGVCVAPCAPWDFFWPRGLGSVLEPL